MNDVINFLISLVTVICEVFVFPCAICKGGVVILGWDLLLPIGCVYMR